MVAPCPEARESQNADLHSLPQHLTSLTNPQGIFCPFSWGIMESLGSPFALPANSGACTASRPLLWFLSAPRPPPSALKTLVKAKVHAKSERVREEGRETSRPRQSVPPELSRKGLLKRQESKLRGHKVQACTSRASSSIYKTEPQSIHNKLRMSQDLSGRCHCAGSCFISLACTPSSQSYLSLSSSSGSGTSLPQSPPNWCPPTPC